MSKFIKIGNLFTIFITLSCVGVLASCTSIPSKIEPVTNFNPEMYLGDWYEIGRFDFRWEKNMKNVKANYSMNKNGSIKVTNTGYDYSTGKFKSSIGKAKFVKGKDLGALEVSFFGPFYSDYTIIALDENYQYALVAGNNKKLLWILSRTPTIPDYIKQDYVKRAENAGYDLTNFIWTSQD